MRITTQMINNAAREAGLPITCGSMLDNQTIGKDIDSNSLLNVLNKKTNSSTNQQQKKQYEKIETAADRLLQQVEKLTGEDSVLQKSEEERDDQKLYDEVTALVDGYNTMLKNLSSTSNTLDSYYQYMLKDAAQENKEALSSIGITIDKNGELKLDAEKLKQADMKTIRSVLGSDSDFMKKTAFLAERISDHAATNLNSASFQYDAGGNAYSSLVNRYDFWS